MKRLLICACISVINMAILFGASIKQHAKGDGIVQANGNLNHIINTINKYIQHITITLFPEKPPKAKPVRSELKLPDASILLQRPALITALNNQFNKSQQGIKTVALVGIVGIGGVGKTTLAHMWGRLYGQKYPNASIWELNAETATSLSNSFRELATALAQTPQQKEDLGFINQIQNAAEQEKQRLNFVKTCLKEQPGWLMIFDNVEAYKDIKDYLPHDPSVWGKGHVLITTRNTHLQDVETIKTNNIINLEELSSEETLQLFCRICFKCEPERLSFEERSQTQAFLKHIPPFPLDISTAARYLTHYKLSYEEYLSQLKVQSDEFNRHQESLLKESGEYTKTRYSIITLVLKRIMETNQDFNELLLLISLLDSQDIPAELLDYYHTKHTTHQFLDELKKYSLITRENRTANFHLFSLHRSTQDICKIYLQQALQFTPEHTFIKSIVGKIETYINHIIDTDNFDGMIFFEQHVKSLLKNPLLQKMNIFLMVSIGFISLYTDANHTGAQRVLENCLEKSDKNFINSRLQQARLLTYLGCAYRVNGYMEKAKSALEEGLNTYIREGARDNHLGRAQCAKVLGKVYCELGQYAKGIQLLEKEVKVFSEYFSTIPLSTARMLSSLGKIYKEVGRYNEAAVLLKKSISLFQQQKSLNHVGFAIANMHLANVYETTGNYKFAKDCVKKSFTFYERNFPKTHLNFIWALSNLIRVYYKLGCEEKSRSLILNIRKLMKPQNNEINVQAPWIMAYTGITWEELGMFNIAKPYLEITLRLYEEINAEKHVNYIWSVFSLAKVQKHLQNYKKAKELLTKSLVSFKSHYGSNHFQVARVLQVLGEIYFEEQNISEAERLFLLSFNIFRTNQDTPNHPDRYLPLVGLSKVYRYKAGVLMKSKQFMEAKNFKQQANKCLTQALKVVYSIFPQHSIHIQRIQAELKEKS